MIRHITRSDLVADIDIGRTISTSHLPASPATWSDRRYQGKAVELIASPTISSRLFSVYQQEANIFFVDAIFLPIPESDARQCRLCRDHGHSADQVQELTPQKDFQCDLIDGTWKQRTGATCPYCANARQADFPSSGFRDAVATTCSAFPSTPHDRNLSKLDRQTLLGTSPQSLRRRTRTHFKERPHECVACEATKSPTPGR